MHIRKFACLAAVLCITLFSCTQPQEPRAATPQEASAPAAAKVTFASHIAPMFATSCNNCHAGGQRKGNFVLGTYAELMAGGESGPVIVPGNPDGSQLYRMVTKQEEPFMPRKGDPLTQAQLDTLRQWIQDGAPEA